MPGYSKIEITSVGNVYGTVVKIDGVAVKGVRRVTFEHGANEMPRVTLELFPREIAVEGGALIDRIMICPACRKEVEPPVEPPVAPVSARLVEFSATFAETE